LEQLFGYFVTAFFHRESLDALLAYRTPQNRSNLKIQLNRQEDTERDNLIFDLKNLITVKIN